MLPQRMYIQAKLLGPLRRSDPQQTPGIAPYPWRIWKRIRNPGNTPKSTTYKAPSRGIEASGNGTLQAAPADPRCGTIRVASIHLEFLNASGLYIDTQDLEIQRGSALFPMWELIAEQRDERFAWIPE